MSREYSSVRAEVLFLIDRQLVYKMMIVWHNMSNCYVRNCEKHSGNDPTLFINLVIYLPFSLQLYFSLCSSSVPAYHATQYKHHMLMYPQSICFRILLIYGKENM